MGKPLVGKVIRPHIEGDSSAALAVVDELIVFMEWYGVRLNIWDHFYPSLDDQCASIDGISADIWWKKYVGPLEGLI